MKNQINVKMYPLIAMLVILLSCIGIAQDNKTPTKTKVFELNQPGTLNAKSSGGSIVVKTHTENTVIVELYIRKNGKILSPSDRIVDDVLENYDLQIEKNGSVITANAKRKTNFIPWNNTGISLI